MRPNRNGHSTWANGQCRFCGESNANEAYTCPQLKPRLAAKEAKARASSGGAT